MRKPIAFIIAFVAVFAFVACKTEKTAVNNFNTLDIPPCVVTSPPESLHLDPFYKKYVNVNGLPLISSWRVPDSAFVAAHRTIYAMTCMLDPKIVDMMVKSNARVAIMARYEGTTDIPEHRYLVNDTTLNWDVRARGLGGTVEEPLTSCAEESILAYQIDKYHAEDILVHEFSHAIHCIGIIQVYPDFNKRLQKLYDKAMANGSIANTYRTSTIEEYWAEAVQDWFNVNAEMPYPDGKHNWCNTRKELKELDPDLYALLAEFFPETDMQISKHKCENIYGKNGRYK